MSKSGEPVRVDVRRRSRTFEAEAVCQVQAAAATVWEAITDYPALPNFMPGIRACRVVERTQVGRSSERLRVEQEGEFRFMGFAQQLKLQLEIEHEARRVAFARALSFRSGRAQGTRTGKVRRPLRTAGRTRTRPVNLRYSALIVSRLPPPPGIGTVAVRHNLEAQLRAVVAECERRAAAPGRQGTVAGAR